MADLSEQAAAAEIANQVAIATAAVKEAMRVADLHGLTFSMSIMDNSSEYYGKGFTNDDGYGAGEDGEFDSEGGWRNSSSYC